MNKKENYSTKFQIGNRTYFLNSKETKDGDQYLKITESKRVGENEFERREIIVLEEGLKKFSEKMNEIVEQMQGKSYSILDKRKVHSNAYKPWNEEDDNQLEILYCEGKSVKELAGIFERNKGAISSRIKKLELKEKYE